MRLDGLDPVLLIASLALLGIGLVMVASASISIADRNLSSPFYYLQRQTLYVMLGLMAGWLVYQLRLVYWEKSGMALLGLSLFLLIMVLIPGIGKEVNGSTRWISLGVFNLQVSEAVKLFLIIYVAGYLVRHGETVRTSIWGFIKPMMMIGLAAFLLLEQPDFGATVVIIGTVLAMMYLGGVHFVQFLIFVGLFSTAAYLLIVTSPYRMERMTSFLNPWADPYNSGFQLTQSLIAIGTGGWFGTGLGGSVQKLFYLPEAHTDFLFAVLSEELGFLGVFTVIALYAVVFYRATQIGLQAEKCGNRFAAYVAYGIGIWLAMQATINIGVNMGVLPTKGLTLPMMSYGGSSVIICCMAIGLLLRIHHECAEYKQQAINRRAARKGDRKRSSGRRSER
jgi:cell division protein FtsW